MTLATVAQALEDWNTDAGAGLHGGEMNGRLARIAEELERLKLPGPGAPGAREDAARLARAVATAGHLIAHGLRTFDARADALAPAGYGPSGTPGLEQLARTLAVARTVSVEG